MQVTDIEISDYDYCARTARHQARVHVVMGNRHINLMCHVSLADDESADTRRAAFLAEAARQLSRMPEFRTGREDVVIADRPDGPSPEMA